MKYQFIALHQQDYPISTLCRVLAVSASRVLRLAAARTQQA